MVVELDIFSGRPNPKWDLSPEQTAELRQKLIHARPGAGNTALFERLGYRGLIVRDPGRPGEMVRIGFGSIMQQGGSGEPKSYADPNRELERWLLSTGKGKIDERFTKLEQLE
jgi:hypothetical protein